MPYVALIIFYSDHSFHHHSHFEYFISYPSIDALARVYGNGIVMIPARLKINNCLILHVFYFALAIYISLSVSGIHCWILVQIHRMLPGMLKH